MGSPEPGPQGIGNSRSPQRGQRRARRSPAPPLGHLHPDVPVRSVGSRDEKVRGATMIRYVVVLFGLDPCEKDETTRCPALAYGFETSEGASTFMKTRPEWELPHCLVMMHDADRKAWRVRSAHGLVLDFTLDESDEAIKAARDFARKDQLNAYIIDLGTGTGSTVRPDGRIT